MCPTNNQPPAEITIDDDNVSVLSDPPTSEEHRTFIATLNDTISSFLSPLASSTQYIFKGLKKPSPKTSIAGLLERIPPEGYLDLESLKNTLALNNQILQSWDKMKSSSVEEQNAYTQIRQAFLTMQEIVEEMLAFPRPANNTELEACLAYERVMKKYFECLSSEAKRLSIFTEKVFQHKQLKLFLAVGLFREYLDNLSVIHLFNQRNEPINNTLIKERADALIECERLTERIEKSLYCRDTATNNFARQATWCLLIREKRESKCFDKPCKKDTQVLLNEFKEHSLEFMQVLVENPHNYLPVYDEQDLKSVLLDLCYSKDPSGYVKLIKDSKRFKEFIESFVSISPSLLDYLTSLHDVHKIDSAVLWEKRARLTALIQKEMECVLDARAKPKASPVVRSTFDIFSPSKAKVTPVISQDETLTIGSGLSS